MIYIKDFHKHKRKLHFLVAMILLIIASWSITTHFKHKAEAKAREMQRQKMSGLIDKMEKERMERERGRILKEVQVAADVMSSKTTSASEKMNALQTLAKHAVDLKYELSSSSIVNISGTLQKFGITGRRLFVDGERGWFNRNTGEEILNPSPLFSINLSIKSGFNLQNATFSNMRITGNFSTVNLQGAVFHNVDFYNVKFNGANLENAEFRDVYFDNTEFSSANLQNANFHNISFDDVNFYNANVEGVIFQDACFGDTKFHRTKFSDATRFHNVNLTGAMFYDVMNPLDKTRYAQNFEKAEYITIFIDGESKKEAQKYMLDSLLPTSRDYTFEEVAHNVAPLDVIAKSYNGKVIKCFFKEYHDGQGYRSYFVDVKKKTDKQILKGVIL